MRIRGWIGALLVGALMCGAGVGLAGCGLLGSKERETQMREMESELSQLGAPVTGASVRELGSGAKYANVSVEVAQGTEAVSTEMLREMLEIVARGTPERYPSVDFDVSTPDYQPVDLTEQARELEVYAYAFAGAGTLAFNRVDLVELVQRW